MTIFTCEREWESMLCAIYAASESRIGHKDIRFAFEPVGQYDLFDKYIHIERDEVKAGKVMDCICTEISPVFYDRLSYLGMAYEEDVLDVIYHVLLLGYNFGPGVLDMFKFRDVARYQEICIRLGKEVNRFQEFARFNRVSGDRFISHIEPKSRVVIPLGYIFEDRMPSEHWMIVDDAHLEAVIHPRDEHFYFQRITPEELSNLRKSEEETDEFTDMWRVFFDSIAIKERENYRCQRNLLPIWCRKNMTEFKH